MSVYVYICVYINIDFVLFTVLYMSAFLFLSFKL